MNSNPIVMAMAKIARHTLLRARGVIVISCSAVREFLALQREGAGPANLGNGGAV
jgi:hypothetical protein